MLTNEQFAAAQKAQLATLVGLTATGIEATEKLVVLNLDTTKAALAEASAQAQAVLSAKDVQSLFALQAELLQPSTEKAGAYGRKLYDIIAGVQSEFSKVGEAGAADAQKKFVALVEAAAKNAPAGSENAVMLAKAAVSAANDAFDSVQKAAKQAVGAAEANLVTLSAVAKPAAGKGRRAA
ncbi:phasin family protein [uncultured Piscinibacter sp.]|uniref:phasin family protein n=1 Tax=uncultured Piscinibacter sp. TaxID=1131835 RepID=UPI002607E171|nr:phasin family protein [uncultured Piscinibacter sp.]